MKRWLATGAIVAGASIGLLVALLMRTAIVPQPGLTDLQPNLWTVIGVPLAASIGAILGQQQRRWTAVLWCWIIYCFSLFAAARIELLIKGKAAAAADGHQLYFWLVPWLQFAATLMLIGMLVLPFAKNTPKETA